MDRFLDFTETCTNIWHVSDYGSDDNDCHSAPCRNLQTVLDRATDGGDIYVTSDTLSLNSNRIRVRVLEYCTINSSLSYSLNSYNGTLILLLPVQVRIEVFCNGFIPKFCELIRLIESI